jgi:hypothetical protein
VGGFSYCYSSLDVCRICHQQHKDLPDISGIPKADPGTIAEYDAAVDNLVPGECGEYGLNLACIFNDLQSFHGKSYIPIDAIHDFCEKVALPPRQVNRRVFLAGFPHGDPESVEFTRHGDPPLGRHYLRPTYVPICRWGYRGHISRKIIRKPRICYERWSTSAQSMSYAQSIAHIGFAAKKANLH